MPEPTQCPNGHELTPENRYWRYEYATQEMSLKGCRKCQSIWGAPGRRQCHAPRRSGAYLYPPEPLQLSKFYEGYPRANQVRFDINRRFLFQKAGFDPSQRWYRGAADTWRKEPDSSFPGWRHNLSRKLKVDKRALRALLHSTDIGRDWESYLRRRAGWEADSRKWAEYRKQMNRIDGARKGARTRARKKAKAEKRVVEGKEKRAPGRPRKSSWELDLSVLREPHLSPKGE